MKILIIISSLFILVDIFLLDGHLYNNVSLMIAEYSFLKWGVILVFSFVASLTLFKLNLNYFAELAKKDQIEEESNETNELDESDETMNTENVQELQVSDQSKTNINLDDIGNKTLPKN